jgi:general secretion pathway protein G
MKQGLPKRCLRQLKGAVADNTMTTLFFKNRRGISLIELLVTAVILGILGSVALPLSHMVTVRSHEIELKRTLRTIRNAIDEFKKDYDKAVDDKKIIASVNKSGYPENLQQLVDGYDFGGLFTYKKKYLRRIPVDPMNPPEKGEQLRWGLRSYSDPPDTTSWGGQDVYDVYSLSNGTGIDGSNYKEW